jgi:ABC-type branched-subunit amino acid transport system ATPase component
VADRVPHPRLAIDDLHVYYGTSHVVQGVTLQVRDECVALLGRNGMGKTTLLRAIIGITPPRAGSVRLDGTELSGRGPSQIASLGIGYVPQGRRLFPSLTVDEHLNLTHMRTDRPHAWTPERVYTLFPELAGRKRLSGARLSGGEQQMLAIGRALVINPKLLLLDEPSEGLSPVATDRVIEVIHHLRQEGGISILLVEQNIRVADAVADRVYVMLTGQIVHEAPGAEFAGDAPTRATYLGV